MQRYNSNFSDTIAKAIFLLVLITLCNSGYSQKIQYSKGTFPMYNSGESLLVANVGGNHHVLTFVADKKPGIYVFNSQLQLFQKAKIDFPISRNCDIQIVAFSNFYYLYLHALNSTSHLLWKVDDIGNVTSLSPVFQKLVDSSIKPYRATLQLNNDNGKFYVTARKSTIPSTFDEQTCIALIGTELPGKVQKVACEPYDYVVKETGETLTLSHRYEYMEENAINTKVEKSASTIDEFMSNVPTGTTFSTNGHLVDHE